MIIVIILCIALFCLCIHQSNKIDELQTIVYRLKKENEDLRKTTDSTIIEQNNKIIDNNQSIEIVRNETKSTIINTENKKQIIIEKPKTEEKPIIKSVQNDNEEDRTINEQERKNTTILATGASFIILAAIVLLTSTWQVMPDIIKTGILLLIAVIFFGLSSFAKRKKLNKAAKAFYYIAMAYIPIFFISISAFGFLGEFLSIKGDGKFIYFTLAGIVNSYFYFKEYKKNKMPELFWGSFLIQVFTVVMFSCIFEVKIQNIVFSTLLYNIIFMILTNNNKTLKGNEYVFSILPYFGLIFCGFLFFNIKSFVVLCDIFFVATNFLILFFKNKKNSNFVIFNTAINIMCLYFVWHINSDLTLVLKNIIAILFYCLINGCIVEINKNTFIKHSAIIQLLIFTQIVFFYNLSSNLNMLVISLIQLIISIYSYIKLKRSVFLLQFASVLIFLYTIISQILLAFVLEISNYQWYVFSCICTFILYEFINKYLIKTKELKNLNFYMSHAYIAIIVVFTLIFNLKAFTNDIFDWLLITMIYIYSMYKCKASSEAVVFKYVSYITIGATLYVISNCIGINTSVKLVIPSIIAVLFLSIENKLKINSDMDYVFKTILYIISYLFIAFIHGIGAVVVAMILTAIINVADYLQKNNQSLIKLSDQIIPFIGFIMVGLITFIKKEVDPFVLQVTYLCIFMLNSVCETLNEKKELFTITAVIYLIMAVASLHNKYFGAIIFLIWNIYNYFIISKEEEYNLLFKVAIYINLLVLYNFIIGDLQLAIYATFRLLGYLIFSLAISENIKESFLDAPIKEIAVTLINIIALMMYLSNFDGMLFTLVLIALVIYSYYSKSGNLFLVTIANIILNIFALTRKFWFSVPWWVYLLVVGSLLIGFAVKNEANENKSISKGIVDNIKNIKEKIDNG